MPFVTSQKGDTFQNCVFEHTCAHLISAEFADELEARAFARKDCEFDIM